MKTLETLAGNLYDDLIDDHGAPDPEYVEIIMVALRAAEQRGIERAADFVRDHVVHIEDGKPVVVPDPRPEENLSEIQSAMLDAVRALAQGGENT